MFADANLVSIAESLYAAEQTVSAATPVLSIQPDLTLEDAYAIQREVDQLRTAAGEQPLGWKIGLASRAFMARVGASEPFWARTFAGRIFDSPAELDRRRWRNPKFEPELALILGEDLIGPGVTPEQARRSIRAVRPAFEIIDSRAAVDGIVVIEMVADTGAFGGAVLGPEIPTDGLDLDAVTVTVREGTDGAADIAGAASVLMDGPTGCLAWLANRVAASGFSLHAGDIVLSGTMTGAHPITDWPASVVYHGLGPNPITLSVVAR